ncbi:hypothetical protein GQ44DRAFT_611659 [Phaeosphaeriaceae sp. PMI808]|nr:hypothetical protein GQ44DRAFT_633910 [Phaeosphaeriaceae sp. PMI808]KAH8727429.1 hypothetical protein GQ44DRAFT_611659 [Phaeosphaeriaceae sp. PMI808]
MWWAWYGPQGIAVDPCKPEPFTWVFSAVAQVAQDSSLEAPPFPPKETWPMIQAGIKPRALPQFMGEECFIKGVGQEGPPVLECGNTLVIDFAKDVQFEDPISTCKNGFKYHRGWSVEY